MGNIRHSVYRCWRSTRLSNLQSKHSSSFHSSCKVQPLPAQAPKRIIFGSCSDQTADLSYWNRIQELQPDLVLLLGDTVYSQGPNKHDLQSAYSTFINHDCVKAALSTVPVLAVLDDNDYGNDKEFGKKLFLETWIPACMEQRDKMGKLGRGVYSSYRWKDLLEIILLDVRYHSNPFLLRDKHELHEDDKSMLCGPYAQDHDAQKTLLGQEQWTWLKQHLQNNHTRPAPLIRLIASPIQVLTQSHQWDCWNLFPHERTRLLNLLSSTHPRTTNVLISGDRHVAGFYHDQDCSLTEVTSSSLTHSVPSGGGILNEDMDDHRLGCLIHENNFGVVDIDYEEEHRILVRICWAGDGNACAHPHNPAQIKLSFL